MDLEELLVNIYDRGRRLVIVENIGEGVNGAINMSRGAEDQAELTKLTKKLFYKHI